MIIVLRFGQDKVHNALMHEQPTKKNYITNIHV